MFCNQPIRFKPNSITTKPSKPRRIFKYKFANEIHMPKDARIVHVGMQDGNIFFWAEHEFDNKKPKIELRKFSVFGTGIEIPKGNKQYLATVFDGPFVWHIYEESEDDGK